MTKEYNLLFSIALKHAFYVDGDSPDLTLVPTSGTAAFLKKYDVHAKMDGARLIVYYGKETSLAPALAYMPGVNALHFTLHSQDPYFFNRTEIPFFHPQTQRLYFTNIGKSAEADGSVRLSLEPHVGGSDLLPLDAPVFSQQRIPNNILGYLDITLGREKGMIAPPPHDSQAPAPEETVFTLSFQARQVNWRYLVVNKSQVVFEQMEVLDGRTPLEFRQGTPRMLRGTNYQAVPITSVSAYSIQDRATLRPKLKLSPPAGNGLSSSASTMIDLPTPDGRRIVPEMVEGAQQVFADMYVFL